jgi:DNA-binding MarR family transcriptional regulator
MTEPDLRKIVILLAFVNLKKKLGYPPTCPEIGRAINKSKGAVWYHVKILQKDGYVSFERHQDRTLRLTPKGVAFVREYTTRT